MRRVTCSHCRAVPAAVLLIVPGALAAAVCEGCAGHCPGATVERCACPDPTDCCGCAESEDLCDCEPLCERCDRTADWRAKGHGWLCDGCCVAVGAVSP